MADRLFATEALGVKWSEFKAEGFQSPAPGIIYKSGESECGLPLGGIGTGCMDLDTDGTFGRCSIFNSFAPPRVLNAPFLGLTLGNQVYCLSTRPLRGTKPAMQIHYWGHFPIADLEYEVDASISVGVRTWCPFAPGDANISNTPAICFEVRVRNLAHQAVNGSIVMSFPGPNSEESGATSSTHKAVGHRIKGICVRGGGTDYTLAVVGEDEPRLGGVLAKEGDWIRLPAGLPISDGADPGSSIAVDFAIAPAQEKKISLVLAWYAPRWVGSPAHHYWHAYHKRFHDSSEVAEFLAQNKDDVLTRILRWQAAIYNLSDLPVWLRDQLVNTLHTITEGSLWASDSIPKEDWYGPTGLFGMIESPRTTPHICNPSDWYGGLPIVFFFPELAATLLRSYLHFQLPNGEIPLGIGEGADLAHPVYHLIHTLNSCVHIHLIDRLWQRDGRVEVLREFYPSARSALAYMKGFDRVTDAGILNAARQDGSPDRTAPPQSDGIFTGEALCVTATMAYFGQTKAAVHIAENLFNAIVLRDRREWDMPNILDAAGIAIHGTDFYQTMMLWALPLALRAQSLQEACCQGELIDQVIRAASAKAHSNV